MAGLVAVRGLRLAQLAAQLRERGLREREARTRLTVIGTPSDARLRAARHLVLRALVDREVLFGEHDEGAHAQYVVERLRGAEGHCLGCRAELRIGSLRTRLLALHVARRGSR